MSLSQVFAHGSHPSTSSLSSWPTVTCWTTCVSVTARRSTPWCCSTWPLRFPLQWSTWRRKILFTGKRINQNTAQCTFIVLNWSSFKLHSYSSVFWGLLFNRNRNILFFLFALSIAQFWVHSFMIVSRILCGFSKWGSLVSVPRGVWVYSNPDWSTLVVAGLMSRMLFHHI